MTVVDPTQALARWKRRYTVWIAVMPIAVFAAVFAALCAYECTAAPWATFIFAPVVAIVIGIVLVLVYVRRAAKLGDEHGPALRRYVLWSILWGPLLALATFYGALSLLSLVTMAVSW